MTAPKRRPDWYTVQMRELRKDERVMRRLRIFRIGGDEDAHVIPAPVGARRALDRPEDHEDWPLPVVDGG